MSEKPLTGTGKITCSEDLQKIFLPLNEGKGTAYERFALNKFLEKLVKRFPIKTVLELPADGIMGLPGLKSFILASQGCEVTLANPSDKALAEMKMLWDSLGRQAQFVQAGFEKTDFADQSFDLVWNFCVFERFKKPELVVAEMCRLAKKYVLIEIQNVFNVGTFLHKSWHSFKREAWDHGEIAKMNWKTPAAMLKQNGFKIKEVGGTDLPPWPDINMKFTLKEEKADLSDYCEEFRLLRPGVKTREIEEIAKIWREKSYPSTYPAWMNILKWWYYLVEIPAPQWFKILVSHHPYVIGERV